MTQEARRGRNKKQRLLLAMMTRALVALTALPIPFLLEQWSKGNKKRTSAILLLSLLSLLSLSAREYVVTKDKCGGWVEWTDLRVSVQRRASSPRGPFVKRATRQERTTTTTTTTTTTNTHTHTHTQSARMNDTTAKQKDKKKDNMPKQKDTRWIRSE